MPQPEPAIAPPGRPAGPAREARSALHESAIEALYGLALRITGSARDAEDVVEDTIAQARRDEPRVSLESPLALVRRCRELALVRSGKRAIALVRRRHPAGPGSADASGAAGNEALADLESLRAAVSEAIERLPGEERLVLEMVYFEGYTRADVAASLGWDRAVASARLRNACAAFGGRTAPAHLLIALSAPPARASAGLRRRLLATTGGGA